MKTLLSLTSRKTHFGVFFQLQGGPSGGVEQEINGHDAVIASTHGRLGTLLGNVQSVIMGVALSVAAIGANADQTEAVPANGGGAIVAVAQTNAGSGNNGDTAIKSGISTKFTGENGVRREDKNTFRVDFNLLVSILGKPNPPKTTEALDVLVRLPDAHQAVLVGDTPVGNLVNNDLFKESQKRYDATNNSQNGTLLPSLEEVQHFMTGARLAREAAILLNDSTINIATLDSVDGDRLIENGDGGMALLEKLNDYAQAGLKLAKVKMADADRKMADADARLARVVALTAFFKTSVKL